MITAHAQNKSAINAISRKGFSLVEILVVVAIIAALAAISFPVAGKIAKKGKLQKNKELVTGLKVAVDRFHAEYGYLPAPSQPSPSDDTEFSEDTLVSILEELEGKSDNLTYNTKGINFLEAMPPAKSGRSGIVRTGDTITGITNAFGTPIHMLLDYSYDETLKNTSGLGEERDISGVNALVWTFGHDNEDATPEEILEASSASWR